MQDLTKLLSDADVACLRAAYDPELLLSANTAAFATVFPPLAAWGDTIGELFSRSGVIAARERELCIIALLAFQAPGLSLANHVYWGLMEGLTVAEIGHALGLAGVYGGLPKYMQGLLCTDKTLRVLQRAVAGGACEPRMVLTSLAAAFAGVEL